MLMNVRGLYSKGRETDEEKGGRGKSGTLGKRSKLGRAVLIYDCRLADSTLAAHGPETPMPALLLQLQGAS